MEFQKVTGIGYETYTSDPKRMQADPVGKLMYTPLETVFRDTLAREGKPVMAYTSKLEFQAFFRRNNDENNVEDRIFLFYNVEAPVRQGKLIQSGRKLYLLVNQETEENNCYFKSSAIACNGVINLNNHTIKNIYCYAYDAKNALSESGQMISSINGNMEFLTEDNPKSRKLAINDTFNEFGRTWKITNLYYKDGMAHILCEVTANEMPSEILDLVFDGVKAYVKVGDNAKYFAEAYVNKSIDLTATIEWKSSNDAVATIDQNGNVAFINTGTVYFTATWKEKQYSENTEVITVEAVAVENHVTLTGSDKIPIGLSRTYTAKLFNGNAEATGTWEFNVTSTHMEFVTYKISNNRINISVNADLQETGGKITVEAVETTSGLTATKTITISSMF